MHCCEDMRKHLRDGDVAVVYLPKFREYGIRILDGGSSIQVISYCPWCGRQLPTSLREQWFKAIDDLGLDTVSNELPEEFESDAWWKNARKT